MNFQIAAVAGIALAGLFSPLQADEDENAKCNNATLRGDYGLHSSGARGAGPAVTETFVVTAVRSFDGKGGFTTIANAHGQVTGVARNLRSVGTYEVDANCTGIVTINIPGVPEPLVSSFVIVNGGKEIKEVTLSPASTIATAILKRIR